MFQVRNTSVHLSTTLFRCSSVVSVFARGARGHQVDVGEAFLSDIAFERTTFTASINLFSEYFRFCVTMLKTKKYIVKTRSTNYNEEK